jgi:hypothetical protein
MTAGRDHWYCGRVTRTVMLPLIAALVLAVQTGAAGDRPGRLVFTTANDSGEVWANIGLTRQRLDEDYIPMVVLVANRSREPVIVDRDAIRLIGADGKRYPMPTLNELRKGYGKTGLDGRAVSGAGIPYEVWQQNRRLIESNFFPNLSTDRRAIVVDEVTLPSGTAMIDLLYFAKPPGLAPGRPAILEVQPIGWDAPIRLGINFD